jgi:uncharacterized damage-inducible protein DinB
MATQGNRTSVLVEIFRHNTWANLRLIEFVEQLDRRVLGTTAPGTFGSIERTLVHIVANEQAYLASIEERPPFSPLFGATELPTLGELAALARETGKRLEAAAEDMQATDRIAGEFNGRPFEMAAYVPLLQAINHGTEHRGQVATILGAAGVQPPQLDCWGYWGSGTKED